MTGMTRRADIWPTFEIEVTESGERDPDRVYTIHLVAAPVTEMVPYELVEGENGNPVQYGDPLFSLRTS